jgi:hypothetical protein
MIRVRGEREYKKLSGNLNVLIVKFVFGFLKEDLYVSL